MGWFWTLLLRGNGLAGPVVMLLYPLYASIKAIESPFKEDDQQWLTYWVIYSFITLLELGAGPVFAWIPLWSTIKLVFAAWLVLPQFRGGALVYERYVRPYFYKSGVNLDQKLTDSQRKFLSSMSPQARSSVAEFIDHNGLDAFDKIMAAVNLLLFSENKQASWIQILLKLPPFFGSLILCFGTSEDQFFLLSLLFSICSFLLYVCEFTSRVVWHLIKLNNRGFPFLCKCRYSKSVPALLLHRTSL